MAHAIEPIISLPISTHSPLPTRKSEEGHIEENSASTRSARPSSVKKPYNPKAPALAELFHFFPEIENSHNEFTQQQISELKLISSQLMKLSQTQRALARELSEKMDSAKTWEHYQQIVMTILNTSSLAIAFGTNPELAIMLLACVGIDFVNDIMYKADIWKSFMSLFTNNVQTQKTASGYTYHTLKMLTAISSLVASIATLRQHFYLPRDIYSLHPWLKSAAEVLNIGSGVAAAAIGIKRNLLTRDMHLSQAKMIPAKHRVDHTIETMTALVDTMQTSQEEKMQLQKSMYTLLQADVQAKRIAAAAG